MSSLNDTKAKYWKNGMDTDFTVTISDEDAIDRLLANTDFDDLDLPEIATKPQPLNSFEQLVDINTRDEFHEPSLFVETPIKDIAPVMIESDTTDKDITVLSAPESESTVHRNDSQRRAIANTAPASAVIESTVVSATPTPSIQMDKALASSKADEVACSPTLLATSNEPSLFSNGDNSSSNARVTPAEMFADTVENTTSLVDNITEVEKISDTDRFIFDNITQSPLSTLEKNISRAPLTESDKRVQTTTVTITSTVNETMHNTEWALFKAAQEKINTQQANRIALLEKNLKKAMLFSHIASIIAGIALIAVVSGLL